MIRCPYCSQWFDYPTEWFVHIYNHDAEVSVVDEILKERGEVQIEYHALDEKGK